MPAELVQDAGGRCGCPACGSVQIQRASVVAEDRIRNAIAAHWATPPGARGPDGRWLRSGVIAWGGALAFAMVTSTRHFIALWEWAALLLAALLLGAWVDRRAAHRRGWIDPMQRATAIVEQARESDGTTAESSRNLSVGTDTAPGSGHELVCLNCGHRFDAAPARVALA